MSHDYKWRRSDFSGFEGHIYLDCAGRSPLPQHVAKTGRDAISIKEMMPWAPHPPGNVEVDVKRKFATLINAKSSSHIAFFHSTSSAMTCAASNILRMGCVDSTKKVLVVQDEMASNCYPWQDLTAKTGATLHIIPRPNDCNWPEAIIQAIDESVAVVALGCVHWCDGSIMGVEQISAHIHAMATPPLLIIDGTQSIGVMPLDVEILQPDFVACSVHKWLLSPYGLSLAYLHPKHEKWLPLDQHERNRCGSRTSQWDELGAMNVHSGYPTAMYGEASRISMGGRPPPVILPMVAEALALVLHYKVSDVQSYLKSLTDLLDYEISQLPASFGLEVVPASRRSSHILGVRINSSLSASHVCRMLKQRNIHISVRANSLRIAPYVYNTSQDIHEFVAALKDICLSLQQVNKTVLITGGTGYLGQFVAKEILSRNEYSGLSLHVTYLHQERPYWLPERCCHRVDLSSSVDMSSLIRILQPHVIVHLAAISSIARCENDAILAESVNTPVCLIDAIKEYAPSALFLFASTDIVYDGTAAPYLPIKSIPAPRNAYARSKYSFEQYVLQLPHGHILRLSNIVGPPNAFGIAPTKGGTFLQWLDTACLERRRVGLKTNEIRSFVSVDDVVAVIIAFINHYFDGKLPDDKIWNVGGPVGLSRLDLAKCLADTRGIQLVEVDKDYSNNCEKMKWYVHGEKSDNSSIPEDVTMCSIYTEEKLGVKFAHVKDCIDKFLFNEI